VIGDCSASVGIAVDFDLLYDSEEIAPGLTRSHLPWGLTVHSVVQFFLVNPTVHEDDILRQMLTSPPYSRGTQRDYQVASDFIRTTQEVIRKVADRCITAMRLVFHLADRNDTTRVQMENSVAGIMNAQSSRPTLGHGHEMHNVPGPFHPDVVDFTDTPDDTLNDKAAQ